MVDFRKINAGRRGDLTKPCKRPGCSHSIVVAATILFCWFCYTEACITIHIPRDADFKLVNDLLSSCYGVKP